MARPESHQEHAHPRRYVFLLLILVIALSAGLGLYKAAQHGPTPRKGAMPKPTWEGVPGVLQASVQSAGYQSGGEFTARPDLLTAATPAQRDAFSYRLAIDFLRSLTPEETAYFQRKQPLPFDRLTPDQQKALSRLPSTRIGGHVPSDTSASNITIVPVGNQTYQFVWFRTIDQNRASLMFDMTFSPNKAARFPFSYRPAG